MGLENVEKLQLQRIELSKSEIELEFRQNVKKFAGGEDMVIFSAGFIPEITPLVIDYKKRGESLEVPYGNFGFIFGRIVRDYVDRPLNDFTKKNENLLLGPSEELPQILQAFAGREITAEITTYPLKRNGDGILRKIEYVRYFSPEDSAFPLADVWYGKSMKFINSKKKKGQEPQPRINYK